MRAVITAQDVPATGELRVANGTIVTPSAAELARDRGVRIVEVAQDEVRAIAPAGKTIALGADHGGYQMKEALKPVLELLGLSVRDVGVTDGATADYPDIAEKVAMLVHDGFATRGIIVDGAGIGSAMAANKIPTVRAALCYDRASARNSREHNNANVLTLGGRLLTQTQAEDVVRTWIETPFGGGRHAGRIDKITALEMKFAKTS